MTRARTAVALAACALALAGPDAASADFHLTVPLDRTGAVPGTVTLRIDRDSKPRPSEPVTLVLPQAAGDPAEDPYDWEGVLPAEQVVTFDARGTGRRALRCRDLEAADPVDAGRAAEACATLLGDRRGFFRASDTVEDIEAIRAWIGVDRMTIVGPGYGSYVAQRYALRYPEHVSRLILTSVIDAGGADPLLRDVPAAARRLLAGLCGARRCAGFTRDPVADTRRLVSRLAAGPLRGTVVNRFGSRRDVAIGRSELLLALLAGDYNFFARPDYPAGVVSALRGDPAPLLRMVARARANARGYEPRYRSSATAAAAACEETRFPWAWHASPAERAEAARQAEAGIDPAAADPFDPATLAGSAPMHLCARWPTASAGPPPEPGPMPDVPVLMLEDASHIGSSVEAATRAAARFPRARLLVTALAPLDECAELAVRRFMRNRAVQDRCPRRGPLIPAAEPAPTSLRDVAALRRVPGRRGRLINAFGMTWGDLVDDFYARYFGSPQAFRSDGKLRGGGLRDGNFVTGENIVRIRRYSYVPGVRISGRWDESRRRIPLRIDGPGRLDARITISEVDDFPIFVVRGRVAGRRVRTRLRVHSRLLDAVDEAFSGESSASASALPLLP